MEGIRTLEYRPEAREAELRHDAEHGRKAKIALEELKEFMTARRETLLKRLEDEDYSPEDVRNIIAELRVLKRFRNVKNADIYYGEEAEKELSRNGE